VTWEAHAPGPSPAHAAKASIIVSGTSAILLQCKNTNSYLSGRKQGNPDPTFTVRIKEGSPSSFQRRRYAHNRILRKAKPIVGSRIKLRFHNVGTGVNIFVPAIVPLTPTSIHPTTIAEQELTQHMTRSPRLQLVNTNANPDASGFNDIPPGVASQPVPLIFRGRMAEATYDVVESDPSAIHEAIIHVHVSYISNTSQNIPEICATTLTTTFAPEPSSQPVESPPRNAFEIRACTSNLLFPFATNQGGLDTRIALTNTSLDPFGTSREQGPVTFYFFGNQAIGGTTSESITTDAIPAGEQLVFSLSSGGNFGMPAVPGFQGYIVAMAHFEHSYAFAFISGPGGAAHASYAAVRINARAGIPDPEL